MAAGDLFTVELLNGTPVQIVATDDGIPVELEDGTVVFLEVFP